MRHVNVSLHIDFFYLNLVWWLPSVECCTRVPNKKVDWRRFPTRKERVILSPSLGGLWQTTQNDGHDIGGVRVIDLVSKDSSRWTVLDYKVKSRNFLNHAPIVWRWKGVFRDGSVTAKKSLGRTNNTTRMHSSAAAERRRGEVITL